MNRLGCLSVVDGRVIIRVAFKANRCMGTAATCDTFKGVVKHLLYEGHASRLGSFACLGVFYHTLKSVTCRRRVYFSS